MSNLSLTEAVALAATELEAQSSRDASRKHPDPADVRIVVDQARVVLFPEFSGDPSLSIAPLLREWADRVSALVACERHRTCPTEVRNASDCPDCVSWSQNVTSQIVAALPSLRKILATDLQAALEADPAAQGALEVFLCYPGFHAIVSHRISHLLWGHGARLIARLVSEHAHTRTGIDLHPGATIDAGFFIDHGTGVVVGETAQIGKFVRLYQGVTLGALSIQRGKVAQMHGKKRHPTLEDEVIVYANATILGGGTVVGRRAVVGGNSWITSSIAPGTVVAKPDDFD